MVGKWRKKTQGEKKMMEYKDALDRIQGFKALFNVEPLLKSA